VDEPVTMMYLTCRIDSWEGKDDVTLPLTSSWTTVRYVAFVDGPEKGMMMLPLL
jgi:hypothetical protein